MSEWTSCQAKLNEVGNLLIEVTESSTSRDLVQQLSRVNMQWAECMKRTMFVRVHVLSVQTRFHKKKDFKCCYLHYSLQDPPPKRYYLFPNHFYFKSDTKGNSKQASVQVASHESCLLKEVASKSSISPSGPQMIQSFTEEARQLLRQPLEVSSVSLKTYTQKLQVSK